MTRSFLFITYFVCGHNIQLIRSVIMSVVSFFLYFGSVCKTPPKFYIGFNREKSRNFPKSLWRLKYWILRSETRTQSSLGSKIGGEGMSKGYPWGRKHRGRSKNFDPSSNIKGGMAQNVQNTHFDVFCHKIHNIWARIKIFGPTPMFSTPRISLGSKT